MNVTPIMNDKYRACELYEIRIAGHLPDRLAEWFTGMTITRKPDGTTTLLGRLPDQSALHGALQVIRNMNMKLLSVRQVEPTAGENTTSNG